MRKAKGIILLNKKFHILLILSTLTAAIYGCSLHQSQIAEPLIVMPDTYSTNERGTSSRVSEWWKQFQDEDLNFLIEDALERNLDIAQAAERLRQARAAVIIAGSSRWPAVNIESSGGRARQSTIFNSFTEDTFSLSAAANFELDLWEKIESRTDAAIYDALAAESDIKALYISISARVADLYYLAVEQRAQLELSDQTIDSFQDTLDRVERRYRGGLVPAIDVYQSRQNLASARTQRPLFESNLAVAINALSVLIGRFPDKNIGGDMTALKEAPPHEAGIPSELLTKRPDIEAAILRLNASDERIGEAIADRFPSFNLVGNYGGSSEKLKTVLDSPNIFWNVLLQAAMPIIDSGRRKAEVERTRAIFNENLASYHKTVLNAFREVEDALAKIIASQKRIKLLEETVSVSKDSLRLALDRYMQGLTDYLPVLTEQLRHFTARSNLLEAKRQLISDRIQLARALGGEWVNHVEKHMADIKEEYR